MADSSQLRVLLIGNPNAGKTTLFNRLVGGSARTGNFPGVTVERREGRMISKDIHLTVVDVPGTYSLSAQSPDEAIAINELLKGAHGDAYDRVVVTVDASTLARGLYLATQVLEARIPTVVALNMMDDARAQGITIDVPALSRLLGAPVCPLVASTGEGVGQLVDALLAIDTPSTFRPKYEEPVRLELERLRSEMPEHSDARALWLLLSEPAMCTEYLQASGQSQLLPNHELAAAEIESRYRAIDEMCASTVTERPVGVSTTQHIDAILLHGVWGLVVFAAVMAVVFEALFSWSEPFASAIEWGVASAQEIVALRMEVGPFRELLVHGVIAGVGNVLVFVPQIALLFFLIGALEDSGYLARVAFVIDRVMRKLGLHGRAFVPLLSGFACAVPAIMATRTISNQKDRLVTMLALPLMSCSARLPIYVLVTSTVFRGLPRIGGVFSVGSVVLLSMYAFSVVMTLLAAALLRRTVLPGPTPPFVLELPPYRRPLLRNLVSVVVDKVRSFLFDAGTVILALTIVLWALLSYPRNDVAEQHASIARVQARAELRGEELEERISEIDNAEAASHVRSSVAGRLGVAVEPAIRPLGMDWRMGVGVLGAFAAREVFVSTLGIVFGVGGDDESPLREQLRSATHSDGSKLFTPLSGIALMVFFVLACQCMSTLAAVKRETGGYRWPIFMLVYMTTLAYVVTLVVYQVGSAFGVGGG